MDIKVVKQIFFNPEAGAFQDGDDVTIVTSQVVAIVPMNGGANTLIYMPGQTFLVKPTYTQVKTFLENA